MLYTVGEMAKLLGVAPSTLRYYDKEQLLPFVERSNGGIRMFKDSDFEWLSIIQCLKKTGMQIKDIKKFIDWCIEGDATIDQRLKLIDKQRENVEWQISQMQDNLETLNFKHWYYETSKAAGTTSIHKNDTVDDIPDEYKSAYLKIKKQEEK